MDSPTTAIHNALWHYNYARRVGSIHFIRYLTDLIRHGFVMLSCTTLCSTTMRTQFVHVITWYTIVHRIGVEYNALLLLQHKSHCSPRIPVIKGSEHILSHSRRNRFNADEILIKRGFFIFSLTAFN